MTTGNSIPETVIDSRFLQTCDISADDSVTEPFVLVIFGGAGDLSRRKIIPSVFHLYSSNELPEQFAILAFDRVALDDDGYRAYMKQAVSHYGDEAVNEDKWGLFSERLHYMAGVFEGDGNYVKLRQLTDRLASSGSANSRNVIYYLAVPPAVNSRDHREAEESQPVPWRIWREDRGGKTFGHDRPSAAALNRILTDAFDEAQIYRIDHYLARDPVQNILFFRFSNTIFEEVWNHRYIDNVQLTVAEEIGVEHRGAFYEQAGVVRDIVQNHLLQLLGLVAMEAPIGFDADYIRDEKLRVLRSLRPVNEEQTDRFMVRGQYGPGRTGGQDVVGYRAEPAVSPHSGTPTFFAGRFFIDNLRWAAVPFYLRTGKRMPRRVTEICIQFKRLPLRLFGRTCDVLEPNILMLTIQPDEKIALRFSVKYPYSNNQIYPVNMVFSYGETFKTNVHKPYERVLIDIMRGDLTLFVREDAIEEMWRVVDPINSRWESIPADDFPNYAAGTWGPAAAERLVEQDNRQWITK